MDEPVAPRRNYLQDYMEHCKNSAVPNFSKNFFPIFPATKLKDYPASLRDFREALGPFEAVSMIA